ncbi:MAG: hypothetical protein JSW45_05395 [Thiotrichales bacterium]|nr:MAG: hypothetical protein JSW45_05395 [Thiotrichales bacterium]
MKLTSTRGFFLSGLILLFSQACLAADDGRTALGGPGEAEVIAGTGYAHTLFDSAEQKCQHCHNDLYDTWKTSMHAKSWKDPIFQSKYQDFLRLQASKIGASTANGTYKEGTIQKTGRVCIKCHAPTAYYSDDYQIELSRIGGDAGDPAYDSEAAYADALTRQANLAPAYNPDAKATVASLAKTGQAYTVSYQIGHSHNREGINCAFCHSMETVRMMQADPNFGDGGQYKLQYPIKMGPIGPVVFNKGDTLWYNADASDALMNAFFALIGPEKYTDVANTPKDTIDFDSPRNADGRYTMKSVPTGYDTDSGKPYYTGGPFYGPFGVTGLSNSNGDADASDRAALVNPHFVDAVEAADGDKFTSGHHFAAYGKALCLSCHQRSSLMLNPEYNGNTTVDVGEDNFLELCSTWTAMSDGVGDNYQDTATAPKCQRCHMEPLAGKTVLHKWDKPDELFTAADGVTKHFDPTSGVGPVAEGYLNNHAFMGANKADFGLVKIKSGFESDMKARKLGKKGKKLVVDSRILNTTAHMFPGAHPMRRVLTRVVVTDADGVKVPYASATGDSDFKTITNQLATLAGDTIMPGHETVKVEYSPARELVIQGYTPNLDEDVVFSQMMDDTQVEWVSPDATVVDCTDDEGNVISEKGPVMTSKGWAIKGCTTVKKIIDSDDFENFTRIYGRETGKRFDPADLTSAHVVRPGFDSNIAADNRLQPNEFENYKIFYDTSNVAWPVTVKYKVYYLKKGGSGKFPTGADGFFDTSLPADKKKKLAIYEVYSKDVVIE